MAISVTSSSHKQTLNKRWWKRAGYVAIENRNGKMVRYGGSNDSLDFKFSGEKVGDICCNSFHVSILGLSFDTIKELTVWRKPSSAVHPRRIQVFAGYEDDSLDNPIFDGFIYYAVPTMPPNMWLEIECKQFIDNASPVAKPFTHTATGVEILQMISQYYNIKTGGAIRWYYHGKELNGQPPEILQKEMTFTFQGLPFSMASKFGEMTNGKVFYENGCLGWVDNNTWNAPEYVQASYSIVNIADGMIEIPKIDYKGAIIKRRLNDDIPIMKWVKLESQMIPSANGAYFVLRKKHVGHFRGEEWYTEISTIRKQ